MYNYEHQRILPHFAFNNNYHLPRFIQILASLRVCGFDCQIFSRSCSHFMEAKVKASFCIYFDEHEIMYLFWGTCTVVVCTNRYRSILYPDGSTLSSNLSVNTWFVYEIGFFVSFVRIFCPKHKKKKFSQTIIKLFMDKTELSVPPSGCTYNLTNWNIFNL